MKQLLYNWLKEGEPLQEEEEEEIPAELTFDYEEDVVIKRVFADLYEVSGSRVKEIYDLIPLTSNENLQRFNFLLSKIGV